MAPRKRARAADGTFMTSGGSQTGGTGDVKPQIMTVLIPAPGAVNDFAVIEVNVPRIILGARNMATIMEILRVDWYVGLTDLADPINSYAAYLSTRLIRTTGAAASFAAFAVDIGDPNTFAPATIHFATGGHTVQMPITVDLTDSNGNGMLLATDRFFATVGNVGGTLPSSATAKILYRMVNVGITEYVGIVQSQLT